MLQGMLLAGLLLGGLLPPRAGAQEIRPEEAYISAEEEGSFGSAVARAGDASREGWTNFLVGAFGESVGGKGEAGRVYRYELSPSGGASFAIDRNEDHEPRGRSSDAKDEISAVQLSEVTINQVARFPHDVEQSLTTRTSVMGKMYVVGGRRSSADPYEASSRIWTLDLDSGSWQRVQGSAPYEIFDKHGRAIFHEGTLYLPPGFATGNSNGWGSHNRIIRIALQRRGSEQWKTVGNFGRIWGMSNIKYKDRIYFFGGHTGQDQRAIFELNLESGSFRKVASMSFRANGLAMNVGSDGWIYYWSAANSRKIERFDPSTYEVKTMPSTLPFRTDRLPTSVWNVSSEHSFYFFRHSRNPEVYRYDYKSGGVMNTGVEVQGNYRTFLRGVKEKGQPDVLYAFRNAKREAPIEVVKLELGEEKDRSVPVEKQERLTDTQVPETQMRRPDAIAVVIGNKDYRNADIPSVDYAVRDANLTREYLTRMLGVREENVIYVENATGSAMERIFGTADDPQGQLYNWVRPGKSEVFVYYSGHGAPSPESGQAYLVPTDANPNYLSQNGYPVEQLYENLATVPAKSVTVMLEACFSGVSEGGAVVQRASPVELSVENPVMALDNGLAFTAGAADQIASWYPEKEHGLFTHFFLKGLRGAADRNGDRAVTGAELGQYVKSKVPYRARRMYNREQTPQVVGPAKERVLVRYGETGSTRDRE